MSLDTHHAPLIVGLGGTTRPQSSSECGLRAVLARTEALGCRTMLFSGQDAMLPIYEPGIAQERARHFITAIRRASGVVISSPCYHGALSGLVKNTLDYLEETSSDATPYLHGRVVGLIACGYGDQGPAQVLSQLRTIVHALRGWPTPIGLAMNSALVRFEDGTCTDQKISRQINLMADQMMQFVDMNREDPIRKSA